MRRLWLLGGILALGTGCISADFMFPSAVQTDEYEFDPEVLDEEFTELVTFERADGETLYGLWARQDPAVERPPLIWMHGNGNHLGTVYDRIAFYWGWGTHDVFAFDYAGFGMSTGSASYDGLQDLDGQAAIRYVSQTTGYPPNEIPIIATSLGGFVAIHTLDEFPAQALVTEDVFANADLLLDDSMGVDIADGWFFEHDWDNEQSIPYINAPALIIHGLDDAFISGDSGPLLYEAAPGPNKDLWQPAGVDHADLAEDMPDAYRDRALGWIGQFGPGVPEPIDRTQTTETTAP